jgi:hypothetical protein
MWFRYFALFAACIAGGVTVSGYVGFLRKRIDEYARMVEFLLYAEERLASGLTSVASSAMSFFGERNSGGFSASRYLNPEDRQALEDLFLSSAKPTLEAELFRLGELRDKIRSGLEGYKLSVDKNIKIAVTLFAGAALGCILLFL